MIIKVDKLSYKYQTFQKNEGLKGALKDFFFRQYQFKDAIKEISFQIGEGEIIGLVGPNGAGKTTLIKILTGLIYPTEGSVEILGFSPYQKSRYFLQQIGVVLGQKSQLIWDLPPEDSFIVLKEIYQISHQEYVKRLEHFSHLLNIHKQLKTPTRNLSLGERMKCEIIAALMHNPKVLFLDEPSIGLDLHSQKAVHNFLITLTKEYKTTIFLTSHHLADIEKLCSYLYLMKDGSFIYQGSIEELVNQYSERVHITFASKECKDSIHCGLDNIHQTLVDLTAKYTITDLEVSKGSLEDAIYAALEEH